MRTAVAETAEALASDLAADTVAVVLAGGRGERLGPLTRTRAKPAVPFGPDGCVIDSTMSNCRLSEIPRTLVLTQYCCESIAEHLRDRWTPSSGEASAVTILEADPGAGRTYRGTADAVRQNRTEIERARARWMLVTSGDHVYRMDYRSMIAAHVASGAAVTIAATPVAVAEARRMGVMSVDRSWRIRAFQEKPQNPAVIPGAPRRALASMGVYVFDIEALIRFLDEGDDDFGSQMIPRMLRRGAFLSAFPFRDPITGKPSYWRDIGTIDSYFAASMDLATSASSPVGATVARAADTVVERSVIGAATSLQSGAIVEEAVLFRRVDVGAGARVRRAIVDDDVIVLPGATVGVSPERDRARFLVTCDGITVVPRGTIVAS
jgi:glucose-1-phosphate adenylyltransferase